MITLGRIAIIIASLGFSAHAEDIGSLETIEAAERAALTCSPLSIGALHGLSLSWGESGQVHTHIARLVMANERAFLKCPEEFLASLAAEGPIATSVVAVMLSEAPSPEVRNVVRHLASSQNPPAILREQSFQALVQ
jgi:hypothetical protein